MIKSRDLITVFIITFMVSSIFALPIINNDTVQAATKKVKVTYNSNGGKFVAKKNSAKKSYSKKIKKGKRIGKLPKVTKTGYKFKGWYTKKAKGKKITKNNKIKKNTKLYARWTAKSYTVFFNANGGSVVTGTKSVKYDGKYGSLPTPTKVGYDFLGWFTSGDKLITERNIYKTPGNTTLYAKWVEKSFTISFDTSMCNENFDPITIKYSEKLTLPTPTAQNNSTFEGWFIEYDNPNNFYFEIEGKMLSGDITLRACFTQTGDPPTPPVPPVLPQK